MQTATQLTQEGLAPLLDLLFRHKLSSGRGSIWRKQRQHHRGLRTCQKKESAAAHANNANALLGWEGWVVGRGCLYFSDMNVFWDGVSGRRS